MLRVWDVRKGATMASPRYLFLEFLFIRLNVDYMRLKYCNLYRILFRRIDLIKMPNDTLVVLFQ